MKRALMVVACVFALSLAGTANALNLTWTGSGQSGVDPLGHAWQFGTQGNGDGAWGIPGLGAGTEGWQGSTWITDFHITFELPAGVSIDPEPVPIGPGGFDESTRFSNLGKSVLWPRTISGNTVSFVADSFADRLDPGDSFFVNVAFDGPIPVDGVPFIAEYTMDVGVPEPATATLALLGLGGLVLRRNRGRLAA